MMPAGSHDAGCAPTYCTELATTLQPKATADFLEAQNEGDANADEMKDPVRKIYAVSDPHVTVVLGTMGPPAVGPMIARPSPPPALLI